MYPKFVVFSLKSMLCWLQIIQSSCHLIVFSSLVNEFYICLLYRVLTCSHGCFMCDMLLQSKLLSLLLTYLVCIISCSFFCFFIEILLMSQVSWFSLKWLSFSSMLLEEYQIMLVIIGEYHRYLRGERGYVMLLTGHP